MKKQSSIFINQVGYLPEDSKFVYLTGDAKGNAENFELCDAESGAVVYTGQLKNSVASGNVDEAAGELIYAGDFSSVKKSGNYLVRVDGKASFKFKIADRVYNELLFSTLNYFKLSRCGQGVCHTDAAEIYGTGEIKNVQGGWHDAGDYGRYIVAGTKTVMDLLFAYDSFGPDYKDFDILDEARFELEWMLQLQREDGAVYHKISCYRFCAFIMPEEEKDKLVIAPVSTAATADFAGCLAYAAKYYKASDSAFAESLIEAAKKAQKYLETHEDELYINPPEITTGGYGDRNVVDERYFAACSLWAATGDEAYLNIAKDLRAKEKVRIPDPNMPWDKGWREGYGWPMVSGYGSEILLQNKDRLEKIEGGAELVKEIEEQFLLQANEIVEHVGNAAFKTAATHFMWGSNGFVCDLGHILMVGYSIQKNENFLKAAKAQIDYVLGCNPLNYCYVTGAGSKSPVNPHHRPSGASGKVMPGMLAGGPCAGLHDEYAKKHLTGMAPLKCYIDAVPSYSTNEIAIYWNSALIYLLSKVM